MAGTSRTCRAWRLLSTVAGAAVAVVLSAAVPAAADSEPGRVVTVVRDARTGAPVPDTTLHAIAAEDRFAEIYDARALSDADGAAVFDTLEPGRRYSFFVTPRQAGYGMQWLGRYGGTGDRDTAVEVTVPSTGTVTLPAVRLDPAGSITGTVTERATGAPVSALVSVASTDPFRRETTPGVHADGRYTFTGLGPYGWKLFFMPDSLAGPAATVAAQWSGGVGDRRRAHRITVLAGRTTVADQRLRPGTVISGSAVGGTPEAPASGPLYALHAGTGEILAVSEQPDIERYRVRLLPGQRVKLCIYRAWCYAGNVGPEQATAIRVGHRPLTVDLPGTP